MYSKRGSDLAHGILYRIIAVVFLAFIITISSQPTLADGHSLGQTLNLTWGVFDPLQRPVQQLLPDNWQFDSAQAADNRYYLVQLRGPIHAADKDALAHLGMQALDYVPQFAFIARIAPANVNAITHHHLVRWIGPLQPAFRIRPSLLDTPDGSGESDQLLISTFSGESLATIADQVEALGAQLLDSTADEWQGKLLINRGDAALNALAAINGIAWIEPAPQGELSNDMASNITLFDAVWSSVSLRGQGQIIAMADTGLDKGSCTPALLHDDFEDGAGQSRCDAIYDRSGDGPQDTNGHGTHVAGIAVGNGARSGSDPLNHAYAGFLAGAAPEARLIMQALMTNSGFLNLPLDLNPMFQQAYDNPAGSGRAFIHSNSWGISNSNGLYSSHSRDVDEFMWAHPEFLILFASGNSARDNNGDGVIDTLSVISPSTAKNSLSVGASESLRPTTASWASYSSAEPIHSDLVADNAAGLAAFSGRGPTADGRYKPDLVAPGTYIQSTRSTLVGTGDYATYSGTSQATPRVAGAAALARQYYVDNEHHLPSAALIKATLASGATDLYPGQYGLGPTQEIPTTRPSLQTGWGRLNLTAALGADGTRPWLWWDSQTGDPFSPAPLSTGDVATYTVAVYDSNVPLVVMLAWTDYPGANATNGALVNDLDLQLIGPDGTVTYPNNANSGGLGDDFDHVNNLEGIDLPAPQPGYYTIRVRGYNVPQGTQPYALIVSGEVCRVDNESVTRAINGLGVYTFGHTGLTLDVLGEDVDSLTVTVNRQQLPPHSEDRPGIVLRAYTVSLDGGSGVLTTNITLAYDQIEFDMAAIGDETLLEAFQWVDQAVTTWGGTLLPPSNRDIIYNTLSVDGVVLSANSEFGMGAGAPTAIRLTRAFTSPAVPDRYVSWLWGWPALGLSGVLLVVYYRRHKGQHNKPD